jgi:septum formation protein
MLILASTSPTRQAMLRDAGLTFTSVPPDVDEPNLVRQHPGWTPADIARELAAAKAAEVSSRYEEALVVGADQVLALGHTAYSKPRDRHDCERQLRELRGKTHHLLSGVACAKAGKNIWSTVETAELTMRAFSDDFIPHYLDSIGSDCTTSVGGYKIEGLGVQLFERISGDHFTILGLPLLALLAFLRRTGEIAA